MNEVSITYVIGNAGDGSNFIEWVVDPKVIEILNKLADDGDAAYASGDGLQARELIFENRDMLEWFIKRNHISITTVDEAMEYLGEDY